MDCNCSICAMTGFLHLIVPAAQFRLLRGADALAATSSTPAPRGTCSAGLRHQVVLRAALAPDGFSVNARCLDPGTVTGMRVIACNGRDWEQQFPDGPGKAIAMYDPDMRVETARLILRQPRLGRPRSPGRNSWPIRKPPVPSAACSRGRWSGGAC